MRHSKESRTRFLNVSRVRGVVLLLAASLLDQPIYGKPQSCDPGPRPGLYEVSGAQRTRVPFDLVENRPVFRVRLNASDKVFRFVLDTGSHMTVISTRTASRLNLRSTASGGQATGVGGKFDVVYTTLSSCRIGEVGLNNVPVFVRDVANQSQSLDGYIGLTFISQFVTSVDYGERILTLERPGKNYRAEDFGGSQTPIKITPSGIVTNDVRIEGIDNPLSFIMDTGATVSVLAKGTDELARISPGKPGDTMRVYGAGGVEERVATIRVPRLRLGVSEQQDLLAAILDLELINVAARSKQTGIVGGNFFRHFKVVFDIPHRVMRLSPLHGEEIISGQTARMDAKIEAK